nr:MAG TPA: hypothetical protein [Caudoviricetes sp.]
MTVRNCSYMIVIDELYSVLVHMRHHEQRICECN